MAKVKVFADRRTGQKQNAPNLSISEHKKINRYHFLFRMYQCTMFYVCQANGSHQINTEQSEYSYGPVLPLTFDFLTSK
jgi:hypothetical protein